MDTLAATRLVNQLTAQQKQICQNVAGRLLRAYPELSRMLRLEENYTASERLAAVSVERLSELVRSVLLFEAPTLADKEIIWAHGVLPRHGVTYQHQSAMVRWFFEEVRRVPLTPEELALTAEIEQYFLNLVSSVYRVN
ncbi:MAG: hypothetical protein ACUVS4_09010 [Chloroflexaceae bacterium]